MSRPAVICPASCSLNEAARLMWEFDCGVIPVVDDEGRIAGMVTDRDICMAAYTQGRLLAEIPVTVAMARHVVACYEHDAVESVERLMQDHQVRRIPVLDTDRRPVGVVSLNDLARRAARSKRHATEHEIVSTLAAVSEPRPREQADLSPPVVGVPRAVAPDTALQLQA
jgi:CBS-domain-containing membrane protein